MFLCSGVDTHLSDSRSKRPRSGMGNFEEVVRWIEDHGRLPRRSRDPEHKTEDLLAQRWKKWVDIPKMLADEDQKKLEELKASYQSSVGPVRKSEQTKSKKHFIGVTELDQNAWWLFASSTS